MADVTNTKSNNG